MMTPLETKSTCEKHRKPAEFTCNTHNASICADCEDHRSCDVATLNHPFIDRHQLESEFKEKLLILSYYNSHIQERIEILQGDRSSVEKNLRKKYQNLRETINEKEKNDLQRLNSVFNEEKRKYETMMKDCSSIVDKASATIKQLGSDMSATQAFKLERDIRDISKHLDYRIKEMEQGQQVSISLKTDQQVENTKGDIRPSFGEIVITTRSSLTNNENSTEINKSRADIDPVQSYPQTECTPVTRQMSTESRKSFSELSLNTSSLTDGAGAFSLPTNFPQNRKPSLSVSSSVSEGQHHQKRKFSNTQCEKVVTAHKQCSESITTRTPLGLRMMGSFNAKTNGDQSHCWLTGVSILSSGNIVLADRNNSKVKLFSPTLYYVNDVATKTQPFDLKETITEEIAVTFPKENLIRFFEQTRLKDLRHIIDTEQPCYGIATKEKFLYVCCAATWIKNACIKVYDKDVPVIRIDRDQEGSLLLFSTEFLAVCPTTGRFFFKRGGSGLSPDTICCTSPEGNLLWSSKMSYWAPPPAGIAYMNGGVVVALESGLHWIAPTGKTPVNLLPMSEMCSEIESPHAVFVSQDGTKVLVTQAKRIMNRKQNNIVNLFSVMY